MSILSELANEKFALEMARRLDEFERRLKSLESASQVDKPETKAQRMVRLVSAHYNVSVPTIRGNSKWADAVKARWAVIWLLFVLEGLNKSGVARELGVDHATVRHALCAINHWPRTRPEAYKEFLELKAAIEKALEAA